MARKRSIKPEFFSDIDLAGVSIEARYLFAGLWPWMDRQGVIEADPRVHRVNVFPHDEKVSAAKVQGWLTELVSHGFVLRFSWLGKDLLFCPTFDFHQKLYSDEKSRFNVSDELLKGLKNDAVVPSTSTLITLPVHTQSRLSTESEPVRVRVKVKEKVKVKEEGENFDFDVIYKTWPRKRGKDGGMNRLRQRIKTQEAYLAFATACANAILEFQREKTKTSFIPYWSSFVGTDDREPWRDFIEKTEDIDYSAPESAEEIAERLIREHEKRQGA